ncbi:MAG: prepilin-type N-terminal cleavage/methylation domain-containing protein [Armatimonadota bacterium]|nr:MAG: prepilin-type N-terminal cleavage/methylation domain-containing protein [Armatimonadota bacterium]
MGKQTRGFGLIELLVVVFILAVGLTSVSALFVAGTISTRKAERINTALNAAQQQVERLRSAGFSGCVADPEIFTSLDGYTILQQNPDMTGQIGFAVPELAGGQGTIDVAFYDSGAGVYPNLKDITVTVIWTGGAGTSGTTLLQTLIANRPQ